MEIKIKSIITNPKLTQKDLMYQRINKHGNDLNKIFHTDLDSIILCKKLHRIEIQAHRIAEDYCNGEITEHQQDVLETKIMMNVNKILKFRDKNIPVFFNGDPRGYTLKIAGKTETSSCEYDIYRDWGGYGIIAPDLS